MKFFTSFSVFHTAFSHLFTPDSRRNDLTLHVDMDRRHFCKIASLAVGALGLGTLPVSASISASRQSNPKMPSPGCRLTVIRRSFHPDLQALFLDDPDTGPCRLFECGDEFRFNDGDTCPEGFCPRLWETICATVNQPSCSKALTEGTGLLSCPDGTRPVIIRIDVLDQ